MAKRLESIIQLAAQTAHQISANSGNYMAFLTTAAHNFKYNFRDQLLIYAQKPDATACAQIDFWNKYGRWVNRGTTGIALLVDTNRGYRLRHVFDMSDTNSRQGHTIPPWQMKPQYEGPVLEALENSCGEFADKSDFAECLLQTAKVIVEDNFGDYFTELCGVKEGSLLEELDDLSTETWFRGLLESSVAYIMLTRCGIDPQEHFSGEDFAHVYDFNTPETLSILGCAVSDISEMPLREIASTVRNLYREEQNKNRTFAGKSGGRYNGGRTSERSVEHGADVQNRGGLSTAQPGSAGRPEGRKIWDAAAQLPSDAQERLLHGDAVERQAERPSGEDRPAGHRDGGAADGADGTGAGRDRGTESVRRDEVGGPDEQHPGSGGGSGADGDRVRQLTDPLPTEEEQKAAIQAAEDEQSSAFAVPQENTSGPLAASPEPDNNEMNPPPAPPKEYQLTLGATVYLGAQGYELLAFDDQTVRLFDPAFPIFNKELPREEFDRLLAENPLNDGLLQVMGEAAPTAKPAEPDTLGYDLGFGHLGNGVTVWNRLELQDGDYKTVAHIAPDRTVSYYEDGLPEDVRAQIEEFAATSTMTISATQDAPVFSIPPREKELRHDIDDFSDIDPAAIRAALAENGIVDGHVVDSEKLDANPFIQQVMADVEQAEQGPKEPAEKEMGTEGLANGHDHAEPSEQVKLHTVVIELGGGQSREEEKNEPLSLSAPKPRKKLSPFVLHPEIPTANRHEYRITDDRLGDGGAKTKFENNIAAILALKRIEDEGRLATPAEQEVLAQYVGWGGLPQAFDPDNGAWADEFVRLKSLLTDEEYSAARASTLNAHYTSPTVIKAIYQAVENLGFHTGNILEPSCGIGNFFGLVPESMADSKLYGVELDSITGRIAQQLYQKSSIAVQGFEKTDLPDSFFDLAIGNVPFGSYTLSDKRYDKNHFLIHDYFFARTLDKMRPGGIVAFVTSKGTLDKKRPDVRKYIAERADLLGAIRLPNNAFFSNAGTKVTTDIIFLQKRDKLVSAEPEWVHLGQTETGVPINQYFLDHPEMVLGEMVFDDMMYGNSRETSCMPFEGQDLGEQLAAAIQNIQGAITEYVMDDPEAEGEDNSIPADPNVRNFSYTVVDGQVYYRENSRMNPVEVSVTAANRIKGLIGIRDCVRTLIDYQTEDWPADDIQAQQRKLNTLYDAFVKKYGHINSRANSTAFSMDSAYFLLTSLEVLDDERNFVRKADMFTKRTIKQKVVVTSVDTASEALAVSLAEKAKVDMPFMMELTGKTEQEIFADLTGVIFLNPMHGYGNSTEEKYLPADEYLSGNVREKLEWAKRSAEQYPEDYTANVQALERVQPVDLSASEISVRLGADWLPVEIVQQFMFELFDTPNYAQWNIKVHHSRFSREWNIENKSYDKSNIKAHSTYGTDRANGYKIVEETLNLRDVRIFDYVYDADGKKTAVLNKKETAIAQGKQELIKQAFQDWIWKDPTRRERLTRLYNVKFNSIRPREYDGSHLNFVGINPEITLRPHQVNAIAHILYGGNTLLAHVVGAGKTFEMVAAAQESKRLGLCQKSLFVVPNHLTEQWASEYLQLYPSANILVATKKDFETKNRKRFCGRIATGDYDAIIIGHSQFEKIPMSVDRQRYILEQQRREILDGITELKASHGERFSIKQMERTKKSIDAKLDKLNDQSRKDDVVTFEELGVDRIFIDEAHYYKNLAAFSKMRNVGGISQTEAQKSSDLYMKCRYLDELTGGRGVVFATGTPISNTMVEMYTMQKYLQYGTLEKHGLLNFDAWASTFGETVTAIELAPEGTGYRAKTRFSRFYNLPELMSMFKEVADIQTADMLNLPVPKANYHNIVLKPSEQQKEMVAALGTRAERVRNKMVDSTEDNMLLITNDGRKLALDQRLLNPMLPDSDTGKVSACVENVFEQWFYTADKRSTQMVFCDLSTPKGNGEFNVYDDLRDKLIAKGIPPEQIAYIHSASTEVQKKELFGKVRSGQIRVLIGSTQKMGAGTNVQRKLVTLHHLDCPWRPSDDGRTLRTHIKAETPVRVSPLFQGRM